MVESVEVIAMAESKSDEYEKRIKKYNKESEERITKFLAPEKVQYLRDNGIAENECQLNQDAEEFIHNLNALKEARCQFIVNFLMTMTNLEKLFLQE